MYFYAAERSSLNRWRQLRAWVTLFDHVDNTTDEMICQYQNIYEAIPLKDKKHITEISQKVPMSIPEFIGFIESLYMCQNFKEKDVEKAEQFLIQTEKRFIGNSRKLVHFASISNLQVSDIMSALYLKLNLSKTELLLLPPSTNLPKSDISLSVGGTIITPQQQSILNAAARVVHLANRYSDVSALRQSLHWLPIHYRIHSKYLFSPTKLYTVRHPLTSPPSFLSIGLADHCALQTTFD
ncbi:unnamed protein product [Ranitomeya imitator]|uniref:Uncharacterized protein n=1 Tax=Ranitomeya imitator TaxID=111125 RepID=A0ABN9LM65_9NEOB|nr:unnamed protein product [Ranitomeya imitator]